MRVLVGDRFGVILSEIQPQLGPMSWILNGIGRMQLTLAKSDDNANETTLQIGNRVYVELDNGLPVWGGVMDLPRRWTRGTISVTCYGIERLLQLRETRKNDNFYERPAGGIFSDLLQRNELKEPMGIVLGGIWMGGRPHWPRYHYKKLWDVFTESLRKIERCDFRFFPFVESGRIQFRAEFYQEAGSDKTALATGGVKWTGRGWSQLYAHSIALVEGGNVEGDLKLEEQGDVVNVVRAVGAGATWGDERPVVAARDSDSVAKYGLREDSDIYSSVSEPATLEMHARSALSQKSEPRKIFSFPVTDTEPAPFRTYDLGDAVHGSLPTFDFGGFEGMLRILAREFDPQTGRCQLVVEEQRTAKTWIYQDEVGETPTSHGRATTTWTFGSLGILDNFNRANEGPPPSASWTNIVAFGGMKVAGNLCVPDAIKAAALWTDASYATPAQVYATLAVLMNTEETAYLILRGSTTVSPFLSGIALEINRNDGIGDTCTLTIDGVASGSVGIVLSAGDAFGIETYSGRVRAYHKPVGGAWTAIIDVTDPVPMATGYHGLGLDHVPDGAWDDFGGG